MPLDLADGYTVGATTKPDFGGYTSLPVLSFRYRPALWDEIEAWRLTVGTAGHLDATAKFVVDHLVSWDATKGGKPAAIIVEIVKRLPAPYFEQLWAAITTWSQGDAAGNSPAASA